MHRASTFTSSPRHRDRRIQGRVCAACGHMFAARVGADHISGVYCLGCLERPDDPMTAEHYWDLGGGD